MIFEKKKKKKGIDIYSRLKSVRSPLRGNKSGVFEMHHWLSGRHHIQFRLMDASLSFLFFIIFFRIRLIGNRLLEFCVSV